LPTDIVARVHVHQCMLLTGESEAPVIISAEYEHLFEGAGHVNSTFEQFTSAKWHGRDIDFFLA
jgi:hypothetical protein